MLKDTKRFTIKSGVIQLLVQMTHFYTKRAAIQCDLMDVCVLLAGMMTDRDGGPRFSADRKTWGSGSVPR